MSSSLSVCLCHRLAVASQLSVYEAVCSTRGFNLTFGPVSSLHQDRLRRMRHASLAERESKTEPSRPDSPKDIGQSKSSQHISQFWASELLHERPPAMLLRTCSGGSGPTSRTGALKSPAICTTENRFCRTLCTFALGTSVSLFTKVKFVQACVLQETIWAPQETRMI